MKIVRGLSVLFVAGGIYLIATGTVILGGVVVLLGLLDALQAAGFSRSSAQRAPSASGQRRHSGPAKNRAWRVLLITASFAAMGALIGASGGVELAVGLAVFAGLIALTVSLVIVGITPPANKRSS